MPKKTKVDLRTLKKKFNQFKKKGQRQGAKLIKERIERSIARGNSPVSTDGSGKTTKFVKYSDSYKKAIRKGRYKKFNKKIRPVNMKLSGKMLKSLRVKATKDGINVSFNNKLADIHNRLGAGRSKVIRRLLPTNDGEVFNNTIIRPFRALLRKLRREILGK